MSGDRQALAGIWNTWLYPHEREAARKLAEIGTDEECAVEYARLQELCRQRLEQWRWWSR